MVWGFCLIIWAILTLLAPVTVIPITIVVFLLLKTRVRVLWVRSSLIFRMILKGYRGHYDIYHSNDLNTLPQGYISAKWRLKPKKLIYDSHEVQTSRTGYSSPIHGKMEAFLIKKIDEMIVENDTRAKYNEDLYGFYPHVVHNYPFKQLSQSNEKVDLHEILNIPRNEKILLYQGGIQTGRGLDKLIKSVPMFKEGVLVLVGDGKIKKDLQEMVKEMNLEEKVKFHPKVPLLDLPKFTRNGYIGFQVLNNVCFNHYSASSNKLFEYMMAGVPVVACDFPEIKKVVDQEQTGITVDSHNPMEIADAVNKILSNPTLREKYSKNSFAARNSYNWEEEKQEFLNVYS